MGCPVVEGVQTLALQSSTAVAKTLGAASLAAQFRTEWLPQLTGEGKGEALVGVLRQMQPKVVEVFVAVQKARKGGSYPGHSGLLEEVQGCMDRWSGGRASSD